MVQSAKLEEWSHLSPLTSDMEVQDLEFALLGFSLALAQYFPTMSPFFPFEMVIYILDHGMLEVHNLLFDFIDGWN